MELEMPPQQPEGRLLHAAQKASGRSIRLVAHDAGMSEARWRQICKGSMHVQGVVAPVIAKAETLARMARAVGVSGEQLREAGRPDAALALDELGDAPADRNAPEPAPSRVMTGRAKARHEPQLDSEIDMIYASRSMTAAQKLVAIRMVLQLQAEVEADAAEVATPSPTPITSVVHAEDN